MTTHRFPMLTLASALVVPGLGHLYVGEWLRGVGFLVLIALSPVVTCQIALWFPTSFLIFIVILGAITGLGCYAWSVVDAWRLAKRSDNQRMPWQRPWVYLIAALIAYTFVLAPFTAYAKENLIETFKAPTRSMLPTILPGDRFLADKRVNRLGGEPLHRGDVALFVYPNNRTQVYVKRIIGLPGDRVEVDGHSIRVNGQSISGSPVNDLGDPIKNRLLADHQALTEHADGHTYIVLWRKDAPHSTAHIVVPDGQVFVLGDNRDASKDSRGFGTVPLADIKATAKQVLFTYHPDAGMLWRRIGQQIR
jgi:signal peptidase I